MVTAKQAIKAIKTIRDYCRSKTPDECNEKCELQAFCERIRNKLPDEWPEGRQEETMECDRDICYRQDYNGGCATCECAVLTPSEAMDQIKAEDCTEWCGDYNKTDPEKCMRCRWGIAIDVLSKIDMMEA